MIVMSILVAVMGVFFFSLVASIRLIKHSYAFGHALDEADRQEQRHWIEVENNATLRFLEGEREKAQKTVDGLKASIRKEGLDPDRPLF